MKHREDGFTFLEILAVLMIIAIISAVLMIRDTGEPLRLFSEQEIIKGHLRYTQYLALANDQHAWKLQFSGNGYTLFKGESDEIMLPNESSGRHELMEGIDMQVVREDGGVVDFIRFDRWGVPENGSGYTIRLSDLINGGTAAIRITQNTGYVQ